MKLYPRGAKGFLWGAMRIAIVLFLVILGFMFFSQERLIFFPTQLEYNFKFDFKIPFEEKFVEVGRYKIHSLLFIPTEAKDVILYFHGNAGDLSGWGGVAQELAIATHSKVLIVDYPGYGKSEGSIKSEAQLHKVAKAYFDEAKKIAGDNRIFIYGRSVGSGLAVKLASENKVTGLILETPFLSLAEVGKHHYPWLPMIILKYKFESKNWAKKVSAPVLILHGDQDEVIPFSQGQELSKIFSQANFVTVPGGHHNDLELFKEYWEGVKTFVEN